MMLQARRWPPERELVLIADIGFAALELLTALSRRGVICITRLRLGAALYEPAPALQHGAAALILGLPATRTRGRGPCVNAGTKTNPELTSHTDRPLGAGQATIRCPGACSSSSMPSSP